MDLVFFSYCLIPQKCSSDVSLIITNNYSQMNSIPKRYAKYSAHASSNFMFPLHFSREVLAKVLNCGIRNLFNNH